MPVRTLTLDVTKMAAAQWVVASLSAENMILQTTLVLLAVFVVTRWYLSTPKNLPPGPRGWPVVGNMFSLTSETRCLTVTEWAKTYGPVYQMRVGRQRVVVLNGYDVIYEALVKRAEDFSTRQFGPTTRIINPQQLGIIQAPFGTPWKEHRKFTLMSLREFGFGKRSLEGKILEESVALQTEIMKIGNGPFDIGRMIQNAVTNVICSIVFGSRWEYNDEKFTRLMDTLDRGFSFNFASQLAIFFPVLRFVPGLGKGLDVARNVVDTIKSYIKEEIDDHKKTFVPNDIRDLIDSYIKEMKSRENEEETTFTDDYAEMVLFDLFIAGAETTSTTLYWAFLHMILNPDIQAKVQAEIHSVLGHDKPPSTAHRAQMPYTEAVLTEVARIGTILPNSVIHATSRDTSFRGYHIPGNTTVLPNIWSVHHDPKHFPNPGKFDPGRFLDAQGQYQRDDHVIPFSLGPRMCLGKQLAEMELFVFFTSLLQHFTFKLPEGAPTPSTRGIHGITHSPKKYELIAEPLT
ncbi:cytochrome P450 2C15-like [Branchiostoma floridae]|uniref:Cytochrome P450 2U1 n=1 Tax=Branchiostoma floridae TaxID=7739 RepID=A0A9J7MGF9_BRAFL|nr:cytochrome P450 2C15-like [Branchiostoma floridae]